eukprot:149090_1
MAQQIVLVSIFILGCQFITITASESLFSISPPVHKLNWTEANIACNNSIPRGQLASSHNASHDNYIHTICSTATSDPCWIGLHSINNEWQWIDNTYTNYYNFIDKNGEDLSHLRSSDSQLCVELSTYTHSPTTWGKKECAYRLWGAVCSTCGALDEYCCGIGNQCNDNDLQCVNNKCIPLIISTQIYTTKTVTWYKKGGYDMWHSEWSVEIAIILVFFMCLCTGVATYLRNKNRDRKMNQMR